jgi:murein DD-endopeptidase MepM/ murein hydrolase activator NlpD
LASLLRLALLASLTLVSGGVCAQSMYKYQDEEGNWIFSDRPPPEEQVVEILELSTGPEPPTVSVRTSLRERRVHFIARNTYPVPVEVVLAIDALRNLEYPLPQQVMRWIIDPESTQTMLTLAALEDNIVPVADYRYLWIPGDPRAVHAPEQPYRAPFVVATDYPISQTFPIGATHTTPDSYYAVDIAMPIGTDIYAARGGIVFEVASNNFRGGTDLEQDAAAANIVRIMHDDGSHAVYAHLNWNSIRVRPGDRVLRGEYIADSGNTGFTSGPHLHFAVMVNRGMRLESVPVTFEGPNFTEIEPTTGNSLFAY